MGALMPSILHLQTLNGSTEIQVSESFEAVMDKLHPITPPSSSLEARQSLLYTALESGHRLAIPQGTIIFVEEGH